MRLIIHRGAKEIGGSCVELKSGETRILIDFGLPLFGRNREPFEVDDLIGKTPDELVKAGNLPDIKGLYKGEPKGIDGILISHSHLDHYGLLSYVNPEIPIYLSKGSQALIEVSNIFTPHKTGKLNLLPLHNKRHFAIGDIAIAPYLVDHSAFDALAFLIESNGKRLFYSGDFRGHGRKSELFHRMLKQPPSNIDCFLMEGSMLGREKQVYARETDVQARIEQILLERKNISFLFASSQNIDRIVSAYKACLKTDSIFAIDIYTAFILSKLEKVSAKLPQFNWKNIRIKFLKYQVDCLADAGYRDLLFVYNKRKIDIFEINNNKNKILMLGRDNTVFPLVAKEIDGLQGAKIIYSMWEGYLTDKFKQYCQTKGLVLETVHTSGHAVLEDLQAMASAIAAKNLVPIHTFEAEKYLDFFKNVRILQDKEELDLGGEG